MNKEIESLFTEARQEVLRYLRRIIFYNSALYDEVEDITNEALLTAYEKIDSFKGDSFKGWVITIARNEFIDRGKSDARMRCESQTMVNNEVVDIVETLIEEETPESILFKKRDHQNAVRAWDNLPESSKEVLALWMDGMEYPEIGEKLGIAKCTVGTRINRAKESMRDHIRGI